MTKTSLNSSFINRKFEALKQVNCKFQRTISNGKSLLRCSLAFLTTKFNKGGVR